MHTLNSPQLASDAVVPKKTIREGWLLLILASIQFTHIIDFVIMMPLGPQLMRVFRISPQQFGYIVSAYTFSAAISGFISTLFLDKFDRKNAMLLLYIGFIGGTFCCALATGYEMLLLARILAGAFGGVIGALVFAIIGDAIPENRRGAATGKVMAAYSAASIAGVPAGLYLATTFNWHAPFYALTFLSLMVLATAYFALPAMRGHLTNAIKSNFLHVIGDILQNKNLLLALSLMIALTLAGFTIIPFISPFLVSNIGFADNELGYMYLLSGLFTLIVSPLVGRLADRFGKPKVFTIVALLSIIPILVLTHLEPAPHWFVLIITTTFFVGFGARFVPAVALITSSAEPNIRGSFMSFNSSIQQLATGFSALLSGFIIQKTAAGPLLYFNIIGFIASFATLLAIFIIWKLKVVS